MLEYNTTNLLNLPSDKSIKNINLGKSNISENGIKPVDRDNNKADISPTDIDNERPATPNWIP